MEDVAVETAAEPTEPTSVDTGVAESGAPPVDASAEPAGDSGNAEPLLQYLQSKGFKSLEDPAARTALHESIRQAQNYASTSAKRIKELEAQLSQRATPAKPAEPEAPAEPHPDLKQLDEYISTLKSEKESFGQTHQTLVTGILTAREQIAAAKVRVEIADELDKPAKQAVVDRLEDKLALLKHQLEMLPNDQRRVDAELRRAERERHQTEQFLEEDERARQEQDSNRESWEAGFNTTIDTLIPQVANELKVDADPKLRQSMFASVIPLIAWELKRRADSNIKDVNIKELVGSCVKHWANERGLIEAAKLAQVSREKAVVANPARTSGRTALAPNPTTRKLSDYELHEQEKAERLKKMAAIGW